MALSKLQTLADRSRLYMVGVLSVCLLAVVFVLVLTYMRPDHNDNAMLITTMLGVFTPITVGLLAGALRENHLATNSRLTELLELTAKDARAEGKLDAAVNKFEAEASIDENRVGSAEVAFGRTWRNGWAVAAYARAWWEGGSVVNSEAGVKVSKTF